MTKKAVVERVMRWFSVQPPAIKSLVAGLVDVGMEAHFAAALETWAKDLRGGAKLTALGGIDFDPRESHAKSLRSGATHSKGQTARAR
jgi:hypothetical protein